VYEADLRCNCMGIQGFGTKSFGLYLLILKENFQGVL
jgi:hypothetical protein